MSKPFQIRYYEKDMPDIGDNVTVRVESTKDASCYVTLLEYANIEGMIPVTELSRRRMRSIKQQAKEGRVFHATVIRVDKVKRYIDLSKKQVTKEETLACEENFNKAKQVVNIITSAATELQMEPMELMKQVAWPLYRNGAHAYDQLKQAMQTPDQVFGPLNLDERTRKVIEAKTRLKFKLPRMKIESDLLISCYALGGVDVVRDALLFAQSFASTDGLSVTVRIVAPPKYSLSTVSENFHAAEHLLDECITGMKNLIEPRGGSIEGSPARIVGQVEEVPSS